MVTWNFFLLLRAAGADLFFVPGVVKFFALPRQPAADVVQSVPLGPLDGHYILPHLAAGIAQRYRYYNARFGSYARVDRDQLSRGAGARA